MVRGRVNNNGIDERRRRVPRYRIYYCRRCFFRFTRQNFGSLLKWDSALGYSGGSEGNRIKIPRAKRRQFEYRTKRGNYIMVPAANNIPQDVVA